MKFSLKKFLLGITICLVFVGFAKIRASSTLERYNRQLAINKGEHKKIEYQDQLKFVDPGLEKKVKSVNKLSLEEASEAYEKTCGKIKKSINDDKTRCASYDENYRNKGGKVIGESDQTKALIFYAKKLEQRMDYLKSEATKSKGTKPLKKPASSSPPGVVEKIVYVPYDAVTGLPLTLPSAERPVPSAPKVPHDAETFAQMVAKSFNKNRQGKLPDKGIAIAIEDSRLKNRPDLIAKLEIEKARRIDEGIWTLAI